MGASRVLASDCTVGLPERCKRLTEVYGDDVPLFDAASENHFDVDAHDILLLGCNAHAYKKLFKASRFGSPIFFIFSSHQMFFKFKQCQEFG